MGIGKRGVICQLEKIFRRLSDGQRFEWRRWYRQVLFSDVFEVFWVFFQGYFRRKCFFLFFFYYQGGKVFFRSFLVNFFLYFFDQNWISWFFRGKGKLGEKKGAFLFGLRGCLFGSLVGRLVVYQRLVGKVFLGVIFGVTCQFKVKLDYVLKVMCFGSFRCVFSGF